MATGNRGTTADGDLLMAQQQMAQITEVAADDRRAWMKERQRLTDLLVSTATALEGRLRDGDVFARAILGQVASEHSRILANQIALVSAAEDAPLLPSSLQRGGS